MPFRFPGKVLRRIEAFKWRAYRRQIIAWVKSNNQKLAEPLPERWDLFSREGFHQLRRRWPGVFELEEPSRLHQHIRLLEYFDVSQAPGEPKLNTVLVACLGHIGDVIHAMPAVRRLKQENPVRRVDFLCGPWSKNLVEHFQYADRVFTWKPQLRMYCRNPADLCETLDEQIAQLQKLRDTGYETLITCSGTTLSELVLRQVVAPQVWYGAELNLPCYSFKGDDKSKKLERDCYEAHRLQELLGFEAPYWPIIFPAAHLLPAEWDDKFPINKQIVVIAPGAGWKGKCWPLERYRELTRRLLQDSSVDAIAIMGSLEEKSLCQSLVVDQRVFNVAGEMSLAESETLLTRARLFIGNDSAPLHMATAAKTPRVCLFGPTLPSRWVEEGKDVCIIRKVENVPQAYPWHPDAAAGTSYAAMQKISIEEVMAAAQMLLAKV